VRVRRAWLGRRKIGATGTVAGRQASTNPAGGAFSDARKS